MRKVQIVVATALLLASTAVAQAQPPGGGGGGGQRGGGRGQMTALMAGITLTAEQQVKVDSITKKYVDERAAWPQDMDRETRMAKNTEMMTKQRDEVKALLTDEQKKVFEKNVADMAARMQQGGGRPPAE